MSYPPPRPLHPPSQPRRPPTRPSDLGRLGRTELRRDIRALGGGDGGETLEQKLERDALEIGFPFVQFKSSTQPARPAPPEPAQAQQPTTTPSAPARSIKTELSAEAAKASNTVLRPRVQPTSRYQAHAGAKPVTDLKVPHRLSSVKRPQSSPEASTSARSSSAGPSSMSVDQPRTADGPPLRPSAELAAPGLAAPLVQDEPPVSQHVSDVRSTTPSIIGTAASQMIREPNPSLPMSDSQESSAITSVLPSQSPLPPPQPDATSTATVDLTHSDEGDSDPIENDDPPSTEQARKEARAFKPAYRYHFPSPTPSPSQTSSTSRTQARSEPTPVHTGFGKKTAARGVPVPGHNRKRVIEPVAKGRPLKLPRPKPARIVSESESEENVASGQTTLDEATAELGSVGSTTARVHSWEFALEVMSIDLGVMTFRQSAITLQLRATATANVTTSPAASGSPAPRLPTDTMLQFIAPIAAVKQEQLDDQKPPLIDGHPILPDPPKSFKLVPKRAAALRTSVVRIDEAGEGRWATLELLVRHGKDKLEVELGIGEKDMRGVVGRRRMTVITDQGEAQIELMWSAKPVPDEQPAEEDADDGLGGLSWLTERMKLIDTGREMANVWLPDPPLPPAESVFVPTNRRARETQFYSFPRMTPLEAGQVWSDPARDFTIRFAKIDWETTKKKLSPTLSLLVRMHRRWRTVHPLPGSPTWFKSEKNCWTHFAPVVAFFELFEALRGYLGGAMVAKNLLSVAEADEVVAEARRAADRGLGWRELRKRAKGF